MEQTMEYITKSSSKFDAKQYDSFRSKRDMAAAIQHYSNGTNRCVIAGCDAPYDALTLEHENFDRIALNKQLGIRTQSGGYHLARALRYRGFPDVGITVKCMMHNMQNQNPFVGERISQALSQNRDHISSDYEKLCTQCKQIKKSTDFSLCIRNKDGLQYACKSCQRAENKNRRNTSKLKVYEVYGYVGNPDGMHLEHSNNDGHVHRQYLMDKYGLKRPPTGTSIYFYLLKEYESGVPNYPGLKVIPLNDGMISARKMFRNKEHIKT